MVMPFDFNLNLGKCQQRRSCPIPNIRRTTHVIGGIVKQYKLLEGTHGGPLFPHFELRPRR